MPDKHRTLRVAMLVHGILDVIGALVILVFPEIVTLTSPQLSINYFMERMVAAALFAVGGASLYAWSYETQQQFAELLVMKTIWSNGVVLGFIVTLIQKPELFSLWPLIVMGVFVLGAGTWTGSLLVYSRNPIEKNR